MSAAHLSNVSVLQDASLLKSQAYFNGRWTGEPSEPIFNPATGHEIAKVPMLGAPEAEAAVTAAHAAFATWSKKLAGERAATLRRWFDLIRDHRDDLAKILTMEQGKPLSEARVEIDYAASFVAFYAEEAIRVHGEILPSHREDARVLVTRHAIGVCAAITPWNFPAAMITRKCAPALAAGCTVVLKPAPETPLTALALAELADRAGLPAGTLNVVTGDAKAIGQVWCDDPRVRFLGFTGSTEVGKLLMRQAASTVKKVALELGGNAPFIVFADADIEAAVEGAISAKFRNMGQTCISANRVFVHEAIHDRFVARLAQRIEEFVVGDGLDERTTQGPLINQAAIEKVQRLLQDAVDCGAKVVTGGRPHRLGGTFFEPTVVQDVSGSMEITRQEIFGPVAAVTRFRSEAEVVAMANDTIYGLAAYFYGRDLGQAFRVAEQLEYGMVGVNSTALGSAAAPFGGVKQSGIGREGSHHGIDEYLEFKYILMGGI
jgi:succinate-semialdehyde dehydrogenase / glutarate-semialdehyde dehydrogenase